LSSSLFKELKRRNVFKVSVGYIVLAWVVIQVTDSAVPALHLPGWINTAVFFFGAVGFPFVLFFAWAFEITPEGIKTQKEVDKDNSITVQTGRKIDFVIIALLVIGMGYFFWESRVNNSPPELTANNPPNQSTDNQTDPLPDKVDASSLNPANQIDSIAVLAFEDFSPEANQSFLARGIADTVLHMLAQTSNLKVAARTSSFAYQDTKTPIAVIAAELGVGAVLEGSVQRAGDKLRIIAQLIRASDQSHIWSKTFDRNADDIFAIQDEIALAVVEALRPVRTSDADILPSSDRTNIEAYEHYLKGKESRYQGTAEQVRLALTEQQAALAIDPHFVSALVEQAFVYMDLNAVTPMTWAQIEGPAEASLKRALELAPNNPIVLSAMGSFIINSGYDADSSQPYLEKALSINPSDVIALSSIADLYLSKGNINAATDAFRLAYELDSKNPTRAQAYGGHLSNRGLYKQASAIADRILLQQPDHPLGHQLRVDIDLDQGQLDLAINHAILVWKSNPNSYSGYHQLANLYALLDDQKMAQSWYDRTPTEFKTDDYVPEKLFSIEDKVQNFLEHGERDLALYPGWKGGQLRYIRALFVTRKIEEGVAAATRYEAAFSTETVNDEAAIAGALALRVGDIELAERLLSKARIRNEKLQATGYNPSQLRIVDAILAISGNKPNDALIALEEYRALGGKDIRYFRMHPVFDLLRDDPRFSAFMEGMTKDAAFLRAKLEEQGL